MGSLAGAIAGALFLASVAGAAAGEGPEARPAPVSVCHPAGELAAAKAALARGDRKAALDHLRRADAALAECERNRATPIPDPESADHELANVAGARRWAS